jgi:hypothetical protein
LAATNHQPSNRSSVNKIGGDIISDNMSNIDQIADVANAHLG